MCTCTPYSVPRYQLQPQISMSQMDLGPSDQSPIHLPEPLGLTARAKVLASRVICHWPTKWSRGLAIRKSQAKCIPYLSLTHGRKPQDQPTPRHAYDLKWTGYHPDLRLCSSQRGQDRFVYSVSGILRTSLSIIISIIVQGSIPHLGASDKTCRGHLRWPTWIYR